uniref:Uncharacterized protein LOC111124862 isoform X2 n=1 Tax=Crassostrea virginica TaxID=6565 RepID=A0A8B8D8D4_CRAVI|nr:uncharacterized protein LOC111124862 isoform X2 [Crassostrea virginica]
MIGKSVPVYDARCWPVVQCGSVFVTSKDTVQKIKSTILTTHIKHKKSGKYALALGTSFGHVHSFLKDDLHLLQRLEDGQDQCLMLIKKPKSTTKQMLKSQSWSNLTSTFNSGVYHKTDEEDFHKKFKSKMKKKPSDYRIAPVQDLSTRSNLSDDGGFLSHPPNNVNRWKRLDDSASDLSVSSGYKSLDRKEHSSFLRRSQPQDSQHNYQHLRKDGRRYQSHSDIYFQSPKKLVTVPSEDDSCTIKSDEFYSETNSTQANTTLMSELDESTDQETVARSHSLGDLSTGLTLSIVGQRKAESIQNLSLASQKGLQKKTSYAKRKTETKNKNRNPKASRSKQSIESQIQNIIQAGDESDVTSSTPETNGSSSTQPIICKSNHNLQVMKESSQTSLNNVQRALKADLLPDRHGITMAKADREEDNSSDKSSQSTRSGIKTPNRPRRTLPVVPKGSEEVGEKKKKFSEMVKMRVSLHSSNSCSSVSRQSLLSPESESVSQTDSQTDTPSDKEVSELFNGHSSKPIRHNTFTNSHDGQLVNTNGVPNNGNVHLSLSSGVRSCDSGQTTLRSCDSGQATLMSLSSTVDSGYLTTDAESDISSYTRSLQISAHNLYSSNKLNAYGMGGGGSKQETDRGFLNGHQHQRSPKQQSLSRNNMYPNNNTVMQQCNTMEQTQNSQMNKSFSAQVKSPTAEHQVFTPNNVHSYKSHEVMRRNSSSNMQSEKGRHSHELNTQTMQQSTPKNSSVVEKSQKMRPLSAQTSGIRIQDNTVSSTQQVMENPKRLSTMLPSAGNSVPRSLEHQYLVKTISSENSTRKERREEFSPENYPSISTPTSKGLSYSNTLPRSSNPYNQKPLASSSVKQFSSPQPVNLSGNGALVCDTNQVKSKYTTSCQAGMVNGTQDSNSDVKYSSACSGLNNNTYMSSTSVPLSASVSNSLHNKLAPKVFNHDYVNVQGREIRLGVNYDSVDPSTSDNSNIYEEYHNGCQECIRQEFQSQGPLFPRNNLPDTAFVPQNMGVKVPSLFQLLQSYDLHPLYLKLCDNLPASNFITFSDCSIVLSNMKMDKRDAIAISTPQGMCATIGGPGSAFTPVKNAAVSTSSTFTMVTLLMLPLLLGVILKGLRKGT